MHRGVQPDELRELRLPDTMSGHCRGSARLRAWIMLVGLTGGACDATTRLTGDLDGAELDAAADQDGAPDDGAADDTAGEDSEPEDVAAPCPVWVATVPHGPGQDGSREDPQVGLQEALDARGACDNLRLVADPDSVPFALAVDIELRDGEHLVLEGDPGSDRRPVLAGAGEDSGIRAWGAGTLVLRRLVARGGNAGRGGCLDADVSALELSGTEWSACSATGSGGAVFVLASSASVEDSSFFDNVAGEKGGAVALDNWTADTRIVVAGSVFRENRADEGGAISVLVPALDCVITGSRFADNSAAWGGAAIGGHLGGQIVGNRFDGNRAGSGGGAVSGQGSRGESEIAHNVFADNVLTVGGPDPDGRGPAVGAAIALLPAYTTIRNNILVRNTADWPDGGAAAGGSGGIWIWSGSSRIWNNTFVDNAIPTVVVGGETAAHLFADAADVDVRGNVFMRGEGGVAARVALPPAGAHVVAYNDDWAFDGAVFPEGVVLGPGMLRADPGFLDAAVDDYRLGAGSSCRDAGDPDPVHSDPDGTRGDIGAFGGPAGEWVPLEPGEAP